MAAESRTVKVRILDRQFAFASDGEETDQQIRQVAELVDEKMRDVQRSAGTKTPIQTAVLAGLELVDELMRLQREVSDVESNLSERTNRLSESLGRIFREVEEVETPDSAKGAGD
jgi:cell division protein ZapA (FtsZ GTPase activity inhibitor)